MGAVIELIRCGLRELDLAAPLFNQYRQFYEQPDDLPAARAFLAANLGEGRSEVHLALDERGCAVAFAQLYPMPCSIAMQPFFMLSDLFVDPSARRGGVGRALMQHLIDHYRARGQQRLTLETARTNRAAQALYESLGYERDEVFLTYHRIL